MSFPLLLLLLMLLLLLLCVYVQLWPDKYARNFARGPHKLRISIGLGQQKSDSHFGSLSVPRTVFRIN